MLISGNASPMATEALIAAGWQLQTGVQPAIRDDTREKN